jgi:hypothetical protein
MGDEHWSEYHEVARQLLSQGTSVVAADFAPIAGVLLCSAFDNR